MAQMSFEVTRREDATVRANRTGAREPRLRQDLHGSHGRHRLVRRGAGWTGARVQPYGPFQLDPAAGVLHYAQEIFEDEGLPARGRLDLDLPARGQRRGSPGRRGGSRFPSCPRPTSSSRCDKLVSIDQE